MDIETKTDWAKTLKGLEKNPDVFYKTIYEIRIKEFESDTNPKSPEYLLSLWCGLAYELLYFTTRLDMKEGLRTKDSMVLIKDLLLQYDELIHKTTGYSYRDRNIDKNLKLLSLWINRMENKDTFNAGHYFDIYGWIKVHRDEKSMRVYETITQVYPEKILQTLDTVLHTKLDMVILLNALNSLLEFYYVYDQVLDEKFMYVIDFCIGIRSLFESQFDYYKSSGTKLVLRGIEEITFSATFNRVPPRDRREELIEIIRNLDRAMFTYGEYS